MTIRHQGAVAECETRTQGVRIAARLARPRTQYRAGQCALVADASFFSSLPCLFVSLLSGDAGPLPGGLGAILLRFPGGSRRQTYRPVGAHVLAEPARCAELRPGQVRCTVLLLADSAEWTEMGADAAAFAPHRIKDRLLLPRSFCRAFGGRHGSIVYQRKLR